MSYDYFVRITRSYSDLSGLVNIWSARADKVVVYEHTGDETEKIHIHMVIKGSDVHKKQLKNLVGYLNLKGNEDWSFKNYQEGNAMIYMTKGKLEPKFIKGYTQEDTDFWKSQWRDRKPKKLSDAEILWNKAMDGEYLRERYKVYTTNKETQYFDFLLWHCKREAINHNAGFCTRKAMNDYKMLVYTALYRNHNISIPLDKKYDKWRE